MDLNFLQTLMPRLEAARPRLESWFEHHLTRVRYPLYTSVDIRNAGYKIAVVDTNIFPAGFNNLCPGDHDFAARRFRWALEDRLTQGDPLLILPENHTRNRFYLQNVRVLALLLERAGYRVRIGFPDGTLPDPVVEIADASGERVRLHRLLRDGDRLKTESDGWEPRLIICNNDCTLGLPPLCEGISQPILPSPEIGWHARRKKDHFAEMNRLLEEIGVILDVDPWRLSAETGFVGGLDFQAKDPAAAGLDRLERQVETTLDHVRARYQTLGITDTPYVFVKSNHGTYGMNIMTLRSGAELREINRKERNKMAVGKAGAATGEVIVQEGVLTRDLINDCVGEPVIYLIAGGVVGGFFRIHCEKDSMGNLNSRGMAFVKLCVSRDLGLVTGTPGDPMEHEHLAAYGLVARVASLACGYELKAIQEADRR